MTESVLPVVFGMQLDIFLMTISGVFYLICAALLWKPYREEKNELVGALFAFLCYQAVSMFFMGIEMHTMNMAYGYVATLAVLLGSVYMLKFPLRGFSEKTRKLAFRSFLVIAIIVYIWLLQNTSIMMKFTLWYDIIINGVIVGGSILLLAFATQEFWNRVKALGGGSGVVTCCIAANGAMLTGAYLTGTIFGFLAPVIILFTFGLARSKQKEVNANPQSITQ
jgi:hypothetical protein